MIARPSRETLSQFAGSAFDFSTPGKAATVLGWTIACFFKARLASLVSLKFPFLYLTGERGSGKTSLIQCLILALLSGGQTRPRSINAVTAFTLLNACSVSTIVPVVVDEVKGSLMDERKRILLSETARYCYDCLEGSRGNRDARTQRTYPQQTPLVAAGEDAITEPALLERSVEVFLTKMDQESHRAGWERLQKVELDQIGPDLLLWAIGVPDADVLSTYDHAYSAVDARHRDRVRHNVAVVAFGLRMLGRYLSDRGVPLYGPALDAYVEEMELEQIRARYPEAAEGGRTRSIVDGILEAMAAAADAAALSEGWDYLTDGVNAVTGLPSEVFIHLSRAYPKLREWAAKTRFDGEILTMEAFRRQLGGEVYTLDRRTTKWFPKRGKTIRAARLDFSKMLALGLEVEGFAGGATPQQADGGA